MYVEAAMLSRQCTFACLLLLFQVDEKEAGALRGEGQQDTLQHSGDHSEGQQQGPQLG